MNRLPLIFALAVLGAGSSAHAAIYKCVEEDGSVSFQDQPCKGEVQKKSADDSLDNVSMVDVPIPGVGFAVVAQFEHLESAVRRDDDRAGTIALRSKPDAEPMALLLTFTQNLQGRALTDTENSQVVAQMAMPHLAQSVEKEIRLSAFETTLGQATFTSLTDSKLVNGNIPDGEYSTITIGQVSHADVVAAFTLLTNGTDTTAFEDGISILASFQVAIN